MANDAKFRVVNDIPLNQDGTRKIARGTLIYRVHDVFYMDGVLLSKEYQEDFANLVANDIEHRYIVQERDVVGTKKRDRFEL